MIYELKFVPSALKEWEKLGHTVREQFKSKLKKRLTDPHASKDRLHGWTNVYKIKLRSSGYRMVYEVIDNDLMVIVLAVGKRENNQVYKTASKRIGPG